MTNASGNPITFCVATQLAGLRLSDAQIYTLRRMNSGRGYLLRGDGKKADEKRPCVFSSSGWEPVSAPSVPVLYRLGLVDWERDTAKEPSRWYNVRLTPAGVIAAKTARTHEERNQS
ncbi:hypothetical protein MWH03_00315 [Klebsiella pneumoniae]|nr:hypothetical protein [Klebsiella pneumoniae]